MPEKNRPPLPEPAPHGPQDHAAGREPVHNVRQRTGDAVHAHVAGAAAGPARSPEPDPRSPAGRLKRLYDVWNMPVGFSIHLKANGFMDLVIERLQEDRVSLTHYGMLNGDLMKDPDVEVLLLPDGTIRGVTFQNDYVAVYHSAEDESPTSRLSLSIHDFLITWIKELHAQGFATPSPDEAQRRADALATYLRDQG